LYLNYYRLVCEPFDITPDPAFLYLSPSHKEALGSIICGEQMRKGVIVVTGEVGTGKTTIIRTFLRHMNRSRTRVVYILNPFVTFEEILDECLRVLETETPAQTINEKLRVVSNALIQHYSAGQNVVLIIDEAQNMSIETLKQIRMLSNLETTKDKLLQIVLVGQPELNPILELDDMKPFKQRIAARATLSPLTFKESLEYLQHRLLLSQQPSPTPIFRKSALKRIARYAQGVPRVMNVIGHQALVAGFGSQEKLIGASLVNDVIADYTGHPRRKHRSASTWAMALWCLFLTAALILFVVVSQVGLSTLLATVKNWSHHLIGNP
jgi:general secretion pathway protein A